jgi:hypothetical protein
VASVSSRVLGEAAVVSVIEAKSWLPVLLTVTARWMVSPGTTPVASTLRRLAEVPVAPSAIVTVPEVIDWDTPALLVKAANAVT